MEKKTINAQGRAMAGKGVAGRLRREGKLPAVIYGRSGKATMISLNEGDFSKAIHGVSESTILKISIDGKDREVILKDSQRSLLKGTYLHVDFYEVLKDQLLKARVAIHLHGIPAGVRDGGILEHAVHDVEVECLPMYLPEGVDVDITELKMGHALHVRDLKLDSNVRVLSSMDTIVATVTRIKEEVVAAVAEVAVEGAAEGAVGADGAPVAGAPGAAPGAAGAKAAPGAAGAKAAPGAKPAAGAKSGPGAKA